MEPIKEIDAMAKDIPVMPYTGLCRIEDMMNEVFLLLE
jgi:hypothetical protein